MKVATRRLAVLCGVLLFAACASAPTRMYNVRGPASYYGPQQSASAAEWMRKRGIYDQVLYDADTVAFKYGSDDVQTMDYEAFKKFVTSRIAGNTIATGRRPNVGLAEGIMPAAVIYFGKDGEFNQWTGATVSSGRWWLEGMPEAEQAKARNLGVDPPKLVLCYEDEARRQAGALPVCGSAYEQLIGIHGKQSGDVFNLMSGKAPGTITPDYPATWPNGQPLFPEMAPHD